ncbi:cell wall-binding repeat-containing protein [Jeotgalibacillus soli]|uniref:N-acetylmuramoyl-L-alanine amidase n=1 Tax=Jeotgalibacillus soli TaxID=889306 RepID=A0A0C2RI90_9BACL|nr:cell wall-binding repeat-containing protein [Jeotgalibacillus soli]KIL49880.1 N-acetylmuramoyl-L-alanine amidase [Jeotgalibacillus soli]
MRVVKSLLVLLLLSVVFPYSAEANTGKNIVVIDPGHGGIYSGTTGYSGGTTGYHEKHANLQVSLLLRDELQRRGYEVYMTRSTDRNFASPNSADLAARMKLANDYVNGKNDQSVFVSIHHNATSSPSFRGYETYYFDKANVNPNYPPDPLQVKYSPDSKRMAAEIHNGVLSNAPVPEGRGLIHEDFFVIRNAQMPSALIEVGYMTNPTEERLIKQRDFQTKVAAGIANGIDGYFDIYFVYDHTNKLLFKSTSNTEALNYAKARTNVRVIHKKTNKEIFNNISYQYGVYHSSQTTFKHYFVTEQEAINFASNWNNTRVVDNKGARVVWSNYLTQNYQVVHASQGILQKNYNSAGAIDYAKNYKNTYVIDTNSGYILWTNYLTKNFEVRHTSRGTLKAFYNEKEAVDYAKLWKNVNVINNKTGKNLFSTVDPNYSFVFKSDEVSAADRELTAIEVSKELYPNGFASNKQEKTVVLSTAVQFADALSAGPLAAQLGNAPILLTMPQNVNATLLNELKRLKATKVVIVGGTGAVSQTAFNTLTSIGYTVERISGNNRVETNTKINQKLTNVNSTMVVASNNYPDALGAAPVAVNNQSSIVLVDPNTIPASTLSYLQNKEVSIIGGTSVVSQKIEETIKKDLGADRVVRLSGQNRYETLAAVLNHYYKDLHSTTVLVSTGNNFPDALTASALSKKYSAPLILADQQLHPQIDQFMQTYGKENVVGKVITVGGVVENNVTNRIVNLTK